MSMYNKLFLNAGDSVLAKGIEGTVRDIKVDSALVEIILPGQGQTFKQWYGNDDLKKITKHIEFGVPPVVESKSRMKRKSIQNKGE